MNLYFLLRANRSTKHEPKSPFCLRKPVREAAWAPAPCAHVGVVSLCVLCEDVCVGSLCIPLCVFCVFEPQCCVCVCVASGGDLHVWGLLRVLCVWNASVLGVCVAGAWAATPGWAPAWMFPELTSPDHFREEFPGFP